MEPEKAEITSGTMSCQSECYDTVDGETEFLCDDFHYCSEGKCKMMEFSIDEFLPATLKGLYTEPQYNISIKAAGVSDYGMAPRMILEVTELGKDEWIKVGSWTVHNEMCDIPSKPADDAAQEIKDKYEAEYARKAPAIEECLKKIDENEYRTAVSFEVDLMRIRLDSPFIRDRNRGSIIEIGYGADPGRVDFENPAKMKSGKRGLFVKRIRINQEDTTLQKVKMCEYTTTTNWNATRPEDKRVTTVALNGIAESSATYSIASNSFLPVNCEVNGAGLYYKAPINPIPLKPLSDEEYDQLHKFKFDPKDVHADPISPEREIRFQLLNIDNITSF